MKIGTTMYTVKLKDKVPCEDESILASDLAYYLYYLDVIPEELVSWSLEDISNKRKEDEDIFKELSRDYSSLFKEYALIRLKANELYENKTIYGRELFVKIICERRKFRQQAFCNRRENCKIVSSTEHRFNTSHRPSV